MSFALTLNRRQLFAAAAGTFVAAAAGGFSADASAQTGGGASKETTDAASPAKQPTAPTESEPAGSDKGAPSTAEGTALADAALASAGHTLPTASEAEVRKQMSTYPGSFGPARKFPLANGDAPRFGVSAAVPKR